MASRGKGKQRGDEAKAKPSPAGSEEGEKLAINKWDSAAVKNALDDTAKKIMVDDFSCVEDFRLVDQRLVLCTLACAFSGFALVYDYLYPFPRSQTVLAVCAISYFVLMGVLSLYSFFLEGSVFMLARQKSTARVGPETLWTLSSSLPRFGHLYSITVGSSGGPDKESASCKMDKSVTEWFDEEGKLVHDKFHSDFKELCKNANLSAETQ